MSFSRISSLIALYAYCLVDNVRGPFLCSLNTVQCVLLSIILVHVVSKVAVGDNPMKTVYHLFIVIVLTVPQFLYLFPFCNSTALRRPYSTCNLCVGNLINSKFGYDK